MKDQRIVLVTSGGLSGSWESLWRSVLGQWPAPAPPAIEESSIEALLAAPESVAGALVLFEIDKRIAPASLYKAVDLLETQRVPIAIFVDAGEAHAQELVGASVYAIEPGANPDQVAGALEALVRRQRIVDELNAELAASRRFQGGLADEISKINEEMQLAASVQQALLPAELPTSPGVEFGVLFRPCGHVSGDIYDIKKLDDRHFGFFLADAVGHGVPAALMTMVLRRGLTMRDRKKRVVEPSEALVRLNDAMLRNSQGSGRFATAVYGVVDSVTRHVRIASAGHPPPMRISCDGAVTPVETDGCLLGVFPDPEFAQIEFTLDPDEVLLIYSDGFETAFPSAEESGTMQRTASTRYLDFFSEISHRVSSASVAEAIETLGVRLNEASGSLHQVDDLTALAIAAGQGVGCAEAQAA